MYEAYKTEGVVTEAGNIQANELPFEKGQRVELVVWPSTNRNPHRSTKEDIAQRLAGLDQLDHWLDENLPKNLPMLPIEAMSRESIYEVRGL